MPDKPTTLRELVLLVIVIWLFIVSLGVFADGPYSRKLDEIKAMKPCATEVK